jgi:hypothetical protein
LGGGGASSWQGEEQASVSESIHSQALSKTGANGNLAKIEPFARQGSGECNPKLSLIELVLGHNRVGDEWSQIPN